MEARAPNYELALKDYQAGMKYREIANKYGVTINTVKSWKTRYGWKKDNKKGVHTKAAKVCTQKGGQPGNKNAVGNKGGAAPLGNKNAVKHGAYEQIYLEALPAEERSLFESIPNSDELDGEIRLLRLKLARLIGREEITTYDMFGGAHKREITEAEREKGILEVTAEIRKLVKTKKQIQIAEIKAQLTGDEEMEDDGFMAALAGSAAEDWGNEESDI